MPRLLPHFNCLVNLANKTPFVIGFLYVTIIFTATTATGQTQDQDPKLGSYAGASFASSQIESVNITNGNLLVDLPLVSLPPGRNGLRAGVRLNYNSKLWTTETEQFPDCVGHLVNQTFLYESDEGGWHYNYRYEPLLLSNPQGNNKLQFRFPDGSVHVLMPLGSTGDPSGYYSNLPSNQTYVSTDGTYFRVYFGSDGDSDWSNNPWTIYLGDGSRVTGGNAPQRIYDRNNNYIEFQDITWNTHPAVKIIDQMNRFLVIEYGPWGNPMYDYIHAWGVNNEELIWTVRWKFTVVNKTYRTTSSTCTTDNLGVGLRVVDQVTPPSQSGLSPYSFGYNAPDDPAPPGPSYGYGELSSITLPSGAQSTYAYLKDGQDNLFWKDIQRNYPRTKNLTYNQEYDGTSAPVTETWTYGVTPTTGSVTGPDGGVTSEIHGSTSASIVESGLTYSTQYPDGTLVEQLWLQNKTYGFTSTQMGINPVVKTRFTSIKDALGNFSKTAIRDFNYDKNGNVTRVAEYDWVSYSSVPRDINGRPTGIPGDAIVKRITTTAYWRPTPDASDGTSNWADSYWNSGSPNLRTASSSTEISDGAQTYSRTESFYDNPATTGNLSQIKMWDSTKGAYTNPLSSGNSISVLHQYDVYGNPTLSTDARGFQTQITYGPVAGFSNLYPTQVKTAYQTSVERTENREYDFYTGLTTRVTDADNNVSTSTSYDAVGRPTLVRGAENKIEETRVATEYSASSRRVIVRADLNTMGDEKSVTIQHYDQLGRIRLGRQLEDAVSQSATDETAGIKVQTRYLYTGSFSYTLTSNPYRGATSAAASGEETMGWTRTQKDNGGRIVEVQTFSGASLPSPWGTNSSGTGSVLSSIDANFTTVTDQAGKLRRSMINGLRQLIRVDEPDGSGNLGTTTSPVQPTSYSYDVFGNLKTVTQGVQTRSFIYTSLIRLASATNPENGTVTFDYDNNGNLLHKTDARNITTTFAYDALNRIASKSYNDNPQTPAVNYFYDSQSLPAGAPTFSRGYAAGRLVAVTYGNGSSAGTYRGYDALGRVLRQYQQTDSVNYLVEATYYVNGSIQNETYPSVPGFGDRRVINYLNDAAGRLASLTSIATSYSSAASVSGISYSPHQAIIAETYGNNLIHAINFNSRLQPYEIKLGTSGAPTSVIDLNYNYGTTNNNGNVLSLTYSGGGLSYSQTFSYDSFNRLATAQENGGSSWSQTNSYDVYGNRSIVGSGVTFNTNNRMNGYSYDVAGNLLNDGSHGYTYDAENKIAKVDGVAAYVYDGEGQRVRKLLGENLRFVYGIGGRLNAEFNGVNGALSKEYIYSASELVATIEPGANGTRYLTSDYLGSPRVVTNSSAGVVSRHDFKPFGESLGSGIGGRATGAGFGVADGLREQFTSKERDVETGLDYFLARYYSSTQGRFTSPDPLSAPATGHPRIPQSWNLYAYVLNNPLKLVDPDGMIWVYRYLDKEHTRIGIAWIEGNKIPKDLQAQGYQALNFGGQSSRDVTLTDGSVVRLNANSGNPLQLRGPQQSGADGGYVNTGLVRELGRQTAAIPVATLWFAGTSIAGGYTITVVAGATIINAAAWAIVAEHELARSHNDAVVMATTSSQYQDITTGGSIRNIKTDVSKADFIKNMEASGYKVTTTGNTTILDNGVNRFTVYDAAGSTGGPTAVRSVAGEQILKIRLKP